MCARFCCEFDCFCAEAQASTVVRLSLAGTGLKDCDAVALEEQLRHFCALQHLDLSNNGKLTILSVPMLRVAARLETFKCHGCSLKLPPQRFFGADGKPEVVQKILKGIVDLSSIGLRASDASRVVSFLEGLLPNVKELDLSKNSDLGGGAASAILSSLAGM